MWLHYTTKSTKLEIKTSISQYTSFINYYFLSFGLRAFLAAKVILKVSRITTNNHGKIDIQIQLSLSRLISW